MALKCRLVALAAFVATTLDGTALGRPLELAAGCRPWVSPAAKQESVCALCLPQGEPWTGVRVPARCGGTESALPPPYIILLPVTSLFSRQLKSLPDRLMPAVKGFNCLFFFSNEKVIKYFKHTENDILFSPVLSYLG